MNQDNIVSIKGTNTGLTFYFNTNEAEFKEICAALEEKLLSSGDFFINAEYQIGEDQEFDEGELLILEDIFKKYSLRKSIPAPKKIPTGENTELVFQALGGDSVLITRNVRSGQKINIRGNAVIMGDINIGGEIVATGSIVVVGTCRGVLHAGAEGDRDNFIMAYILAAQQLRIADLVATVPANIKKSPLKIAFCQDDAMVLTDYVPSQFRPIGQQEVRYENR
jgi:septum site-determining protein MinC